MPDEEGLMAHVADKRVEDAKRRPHGLLLMLPQARNVHVAQATGAAARDDELAIGYALAGRLLAEPAELLLVRTP